ncbi:MAG TPA: Fe-S cluster assembly protein SufD [Candidatus Cybelea sp.]|nr:Fe-S cluster assembly protein SufD [Candidatus Cybelea sp.]
MPNAAIETAEVSQLFDRLATLPNTPLTHEQRRAAVERFLAVRSGRERAGRFWRIDFETLLPDIARLDLNPAMVTVDNPNPNVVVYDLATAARECPQLLARAFGATAVHSTKFGALTAAFAHAGCFIHVPADRACDHPVTVRYAAGDATIFPSTVVLVERGARVTIVERIQADSGAFVCGATEVVTEDHAQVHFAALQQAAGARVIWNRTARPGKDAAMTWADAELGADLAAGDLTVSIEESGIAAEIAAIFFPRGSQHVDVVSTVDHRAGDATSETLVKSAARERGQARFLGNIRIAPHAQGSDARLRDDALLLSPAAHIDSVPALEIGANDVKAYHGATVGAMDSEQIFYMESRGIERSAAERMIALGFFEPAIERFPTASLREELREALAAKLS